MHSFKWTKWIENLFQNFKQKLKLWKKGKPNLLKFVSSMMWINRSRFIYFRQFELYINANLDIDLQLLVYLASLHRSTINSSEKHKKLITFIEPCAGSEIENEHDNVFNFEESFYFCFENEMVYSRKWRILAQIANYFVRIFNSHTFHQNVVIKTVKQNCLFFYQV